MKNKFDRPTLLDIANHAGVSQATVSRVVNQTASVRDVVKQRVLASMNELGYPYSAGGLNENPLQREIALIIPDILNPYFTEVVRGIQMEASLDHFMPVVLDTSEDPRREIDIYSALANRSVSGVISLGSRISSEEMTAVRSHLTIPMVVLNRYVQLPNVSCIMVDLEEALFHATRHLINLNHTRIAYLPGPADSETSQIRRRGIMRAFKETHLDEPSQWRPASFPDVDGGFQSMSALLALPAEERPTAVIVYNDLMAIGALNAARVRRIRVPEDISVIGIDNISMSAHANPPLTTLAPPKTRMGRLAMQLLRRMIQGKVPPEESYTLIECPLIVRESTGPAPDRS